MVNQHISQIPITRRSVRGFSFVEVLIAALVLFAFLSSANRAFIMSMASSRQAAIRLKYESEILNDIEMIQGIDSSLSSDLNGCGAGGGSAYLKNKIESLNPAQDTAEWDRVLEADDETVLRIVYIFNMPEINGVTSTEKRIIEINPSFLSECPMP
ncbi:MAG: hypothetical protein RLZZ216_10 [Cyanobacteriota bacterium]